MLPMAVLTVTMSAMAMAVIIMVPVSAAVVVVMSMSAVAVVVVMSVSAAAVVVVTAVMVVNWSQLRQAHQREDDRRRQVQHRRVVEQVVKVDPVQPTGNEGRRCGQYEPGG